MPVQDTNRSTTWFLDMENERWVLAKNAKITVSNVEGIYESAAGSEIILNGDIKVSGAATAAVQMMSSETSAYIGKDSVIDARLADYAIDADGANQSVENHGRIKAGLIAVDFALWGTFANHGLVDAYFGVVFRGDGAPSEMRNFGRMEGGWGVAFLGDGSLTNGAKGVIEVDEEAILITKNTEIVNKGLIDGEDGAIVGNRGSDSQLNLTNTGTIRGDILLGEMANVINSLTGKIFGEVVGGFSNDLYIISQSRLEIAEQLNWGRDEVRANVSYVLSDHLEVLTLLGTKAINATGNNAENDLIGNGAANVMRGLDGNDEFRGHKGADTLTGGLGMDTFYIARGDGKDVITDFEDFTDHIGLYSVQDQADFDRLDIRQAGDDVVIRLDRNNQITLRDFDIEDLTYADFSNF